MGHHRALIVSFYFPPVNTPAAQHALWFHKFLPEDNVETSAVTSSVYFDTAPENPPPRTDILRLPARRRRFWRIVYKLEMHVEVRQRVWDPGVIWSQIALSAASRHVSRGKFTALVSVSPSIAGHLLALRLKKRFPYLKWIADFQDPLIGNPFRNGTSMVRRLEHRLERSVFENADYLSANTDTVRKMWEERYPQFSDKLVVTWGGYDPDEEIAARPLTLRREKILSHTGNIYSVRTPNALFESLHRLHVAGRLRDSALAVEFVGGNDFRTVKHPEHLEELKAAGVVRVKEGQFPRHVAIRMAAEADYLLLLDITGEANTTFQVPSKLFDYIRIGRPILAFTPRNSPTERILTGSGVRHVVIHTDASPEEVDRRIQELLALPTDPVPPSKWFVETFNARPLARSIADLIRSG
jgi:hypothetical protein